MYNSILTLEPAGTGKQKTPFRLERGGDSLTGKLRHELHVLELESLQGEAIVDGIRQLAHDQKGFVGCIAHAHVFGVGVSRSEGFPNDLGGFDI